MKDALLDYLQQARDSMLWKLDGLSEYDVRRPLTPTGTNLLGLVQHLAFVEYGYFGACFGRPAAIEWLPEDGAEDDDPQADLWVPAHISTEQVVEAYRSAWAHTGHTVADLELDTTTTVPWWSEARRHPTLHLLLVHMIAETHRHAGHADILREGLDGRAGRRAGDANVDDGYDWPAYVMRLEAVAREAAERSG